MRLTQLAEHYWYEIDGETALAGVDLTRLPFRRFLAAVLMWLNPRGVRNEQELIEFEAMLYSPLVGRDPDKVDQSIVQAEMDAFTAFAKQAGGMK